MKYVVILGVLFGFLSSYTWADAGVNIGESLEWLVSASEYVGIYELNAIEARATMIYWVDLNAAVEICLKGDCPESTSIRDQPTTRVPFLTEQILVLGNRNWYESYFINLNQPELKYFNNAITCDFQVLGSSDSILAVVKDRIESLEREKLGANKYETALLVGVPDLSPAFWAIWVGKACFLAVPPDDRYKEQLLGLAKTSVGHSRIWAVCGLLQCYPEVPVIAFLREMLADTTTSQIHSGGDVSSFFPARELAYNVLTRLGQAGPTPEWYQGVDFGQESSRCPLTSWTRHPR